MRKFWFLFIIVSNSCVSENEVEKSIPGVFKVDLQDSLTLQELTEEEEFYYSDLELKLLPNKEFKLNKPVGSIEGVSGTWSYEGAKWQKQLYLNYNEKLRVQIGACENPGDVFFFPAFSLDTKGKVRNLKFVKLKDL